jgi:hypothetical protein
MRAAVVHALQSPVIVSVKLLSAWTAAPGAGWSSCHAGAKECVDILAA